MISKDTKGQDQEKVFFSITAFIIRVFLKIYQFQKEKESFNQEVMLQDRVNLLSWKMKKYMK